MCGEAEDQIFRPERLGHGLKMLEDYWPKESFLMFDGHP